jgi:hypothetical protein
MIRIWHEMPYLQKRGIMRTQLGAIGDDGGPSVRRRITSVNIALRDQAASCTIGLRGGRLLHAVVRIDRVDEPALRETRYQSMHAGYGPRFGMRSRR